MTDTVPAAASGLPSRRKALASLAGLGAALSLPKAARAASDATTTPDPIFAAIEKHRAARAAHDAAVGRWSNRRGRPPADIEAQIDAAADAEEDARFDMHQAVPQTVAGLLAYVAYWNHYMSPPKEGGTGQLDCIGWEAIPTIAEAMAALFPVPTIGGAA